MSVRLAELINDVVNKGCLAQLYGMRQAITGDGNSQCKFGSAKVG